MHEDRGEARLFEWGKEPLVGGCLTLRICLMNLHGVVWMQSSNVMEATYRTVYMLPFFQTTHMCIVECNWDVETGILRV